MFECTFSCSDRILFQSHDGSGIQSIFGGHMIHKKDKNSFTNSSSKHLKTMHLFLRLFTAYVGLFHPVDLVPRLSKGYEDSGISGESRIVGLVRLWWSNKWRGVHQMRLILHRHALYLWYQSMTFRIQKQPYLSFETNWGRTDGRIRSLTKWCVV